MILSDFDLKNMIREKRIVVKPFAEEIIRENGLDLRLADEIAYHNEELGEDFVLDPSNPEHVKKIYVIEKKKEVLLLKPKTQVLLSTIEHIELPDHIIGFVELRSTWARHGLVMPPTIIDAGFKGTITLEVYNSAPYAIAIKPKVRFAHVIFAATMNKVKNAYSGSYLNQKGIFIPKVL